jgi:HSP20 family protein
MTTSALMTGLPLPPAFTKAFRDATLRLDDGPHSPPIDLFTTPDSIIAKVGLPGVRREDVDVIVGDDLVTIRGSSDSETEPAAGEQIHWELSHGPFTRSFRLPVVVRPEGAMASLKSGLLTIALPRASEPSGTVANVPVS